MISRIVYPITIAMAAASAITRSAAHVHTFGRTAVSYDSVRVSYYSGPSTNPSRRGRESLFIICDELTYEYTMETRNAAIDPQVLVDFCSEKLGVAVSPSSMFVEPPRSLRSIPPSAPRLETAVILPSVHSNGGQVIIRSGITNSAIRTQLPIEESPSESFVPARTGTSTQGRPATVHNSVVPPRISVVPPSSTAGAVPSSAIGTGITPSSASVIAPTSGAVVAPSSATGHVAPTSATSAVVPQTSGTASAVTSSSVTGPAALPTSTAGLTAPPRTLPPRAQNSLGFVPQPVSPPTSGSPVDVPSTGSKPSRPRFLNVSVAAHHTDGTTDVTRLRVPLNKH